MDKRNKLFFWAIIAIVTIGMLTRLFGLPSNISPMLAVMLLGVAYIQRKSIALLLPLGLYFLVDLYLNNVVYAEYFEGFQLIGSFGVYVSLFLILPLCALILKQVSIPRVLIGSLSAAVIFFLVTNFHSMIILPQYTKNFAGLMESYTAGIPFFRSTLVSTMIYSALFFTAAEAYLRSRTTSTTTSTETIKA
jgi:hypothetical protein